MNDDTIRVAFERWARPQGLRLYRRDMAGSSRLGQYCNDGTQLAFEAFRAALSHAAGQEAVFWITQDDVNRAKYQGDNVIACPAVGDAPEGAVMLYLTPAQPPASAEVGSDD